MNAQVPLPAPAVAEPAPVGQRRSAQRVVRVGWLVVVIGFGGFLLWAALAPLDSGVALDGTVTTAGYRKVVQPAIGGVVARLPVQDGDQVEAGQVLVELDARVAKAEALAARQQQAMARATVLRLEAEQRGEDSLVFPETLQQQATQDPRLASVLMLQAQLFDSRRRALAAEQAGLRESLAAARASLNGQQQLAATQRQRLALLDERLAALRPLAEANYVPRNRLLELQESRASVQGELVSSQSAALSARARVGEIEAQLTALEQDHRQQVRQALAEQRQALAGREERLAATGFNEDQVLLRAPVSGRIVGQQVFTAGAVVDAGQVLMEILPDREPLWVDARIPVDRVDSVQAGQPVELMFTAFNRSRTPRVEGVVNQVSADRLEDDANGHPYYAARIQVTPQALQQLGGLEVRAGMPVQAFVRTGERSLLNYLFKPLMDRVPLALEGD